MPIDEPMSFAYDFYVVSLKKRVNAKIKYGQQEYDFDKNSMAFTAPGQEAELSERKNSILSN
jgi:AraC family transcriptional activator of pobA